MGIFSRKPQVIEAQYAPQVMGENLPSLYNAIIPRVSRHDAMTVPSVARARNLICGTVASIPLEYYKKSTGEVIAPPLDFSAIKVSAIIRHDKLDVRLAPILWGMLSFNYRTLCRGRQTFRVRVDR